MAAGSLLALLDDIAAILDDVALMSKVAAQKTAGVLGDDLALNAQQLSGMQAARELPVIWAVGKGSLKNKAILVPAALAISAWAPWAVTPLLMVGGVYLCYEGVDKLVHAAQHGDAADATAHAADAAPIDAIAVERDKIAGAVRTDFVLSAEIIVIALGTVAGAPFVQQFAVLAGVAVLMTVGVYGVVAGIVKLDDLGLYMQGRGGAAMRAVGGVLLQAAPRLMQLLSVVGTAAMFTVGGGILVHGLPALHAAVERVGARADMLPHWLLPNVLAALAGVLAGALALAAAGALTWLRQRLQARPR